MEGAGKKLRNPEQIAFEKALGQAISRRLARGMIAPIADELGISYCMMHKYLRGTNSIHVYYLWKIAKKLGIEIGDFIEENEAEQC